MHAYLLALEIEPVEINRVYIALPLHCTVVHWFRSEKTPAEIVRTVTAIVNTHSPIEIVGGEPAQFGRAKDVPVNLLENDEIIKEFHVQLHAALQPLGIVDTQRDWVGKGFVPHVTRQSSGRFEQGRSTVARRLYVVEALVPEELQQKKIVSKLFLKGVLL